MILTIVGEINDHLEVIILCLFSVGIDSHVSVLCGAGGRE